MGVLYARQYDGRAAKIWETFKMYKNNTPLNIFLCTIIIFVGITLYINIIPPLGQIVLAGFCRLYKIIHVYCIIYLDYVKVDNNICVLVQSIYLYNIFCIPKQLKLFFTYQTYIGMFQNTQYSCSGKILILFIVHFNFT